MDYVIEYVGIGIGKLSKLYGLAKETSGEGEWLIAWLAMNAAVVQRRTEELKENLKSRKWMGRPIEYCPIADIYMTREGVEDHRAHPPEEMFPSDGELTKLDLKLIRSVVVPHHFAGDPEASPIDPNASPAAADTPSGPSAADNVQPPPSVGIVSPPAATDIPIPSGPPQEEDIVLPLRKTARRSPPLSPQLKWRRKRPRPDHRSVRPQRGCVPSGGRSSGNEQLPREYWGDAGALDNS
ncbi:Protein of unknown function [Pyronema omphalodes CBS 100304]|uniref:Uncharacterized protein n=1 Tax=Pyronema omphalodes (strain CBS 100304) TaxID=1076935 RepID=U4L2Z5_PYROM|nr:Protein of unknown function [Pyronema omphalodes CBS 100304]